MRKKRCLLWLMLTLVLMLALPVQAKAASVKYTLTGVSRPASIKLGSFFNVKGTVKCNKKLKEVRVMIYNSTGKKCLQKFSAKPNAKTYNLKAADPYIIFDQLKVGTYYYRIWCKTTTGKTKTVLSKKFTVVGTGKIKIVNPKPSADVTMNEGSAYAIGGKISSTYKLAGVTASIIDSNNKTIYNKSVTPNAKSYTVTNSVLDSALLFDELEEGSYKYKLRAVDSQGTAATLVYRTIQVNGDNNTAVTPGSTGGIPAVGELYLNTSEKITAPKGYTARVVRPAATNKYYYNKNYNIYYAYNSLAPTGKKYYTDSKKRSYYVTGNCTWYACGRALEIVALAGGDINDVKAIFGGDPVGIFNANKKKGKFEYGTTPKIGALAIFNYGSGGDAHIAVVESVINGVPYVSESGYTVSKTKPDAEKSNIVFEYQSIYNWAGNRNLLGYIYLLD